MPLMDKSHNLPGEGKVVHKFYEIQGLPHDRNTMSRPRSSRIVATGHVDIGEKGSWVKVDC